MKYLLVVGFACEVYKSEPCSRVFINDKLIDEFYIQHHKDQLSIDFKNFNQNNHILKPDVKSKIDDIYTKNFPPLRFYEVEINQQQEKLKLRIEIDNNDSNSTNGFVTKSTLLELQFFYFFPIPINVKQLIARLLKIIKKYRFSKNFAWRYCNKKFLFDLIQNTVWYGKNKQNFPSVHHKVGGSGYFYCELRKKYGMFITNLPKSYRFGFTSFFINYFIDKYKQYAN
jgi:hypothetical protein